MEADTAPDGIDFSRAVGIEVGSAKAFARDNGQ
jgi:hypothetical protein